MGWCDNSVDCHASSWIVCRMGNYIHVVEFGESRRMSGILSTNHVEVVLKFFSVFYKEARSEDSLFEP